MTKLEKRIIKRKKGLGEDSDGIIDFQEVGKGFTIYIDKIKSNKTYWVMLYGKSWNFGLKDGMLQFWEPDCK